MEWGERKIQQNFCGVIILHHDICMTCISKLYFSEWGVTTTIYLPNSPVLLPIFPAAAQLPNSLGKFPFETPPNPTFDPSHNADIESQQNITNKPVDPWFVNANK